MKSVESVTSDLPILPTGYDTNEERETEKHLAVTPEGSIIEVELQEEEILQLPGSNGINDYDQQPAKNISENKTAEDVLEKGAGFLEGLLSILGNPESTQRLVNKITEKDAVTGQTYLKLPINNAGVVENALKVLSGLFGGMGK